MSFITLFIFIFIFIWRFCSTIDETSVWLDVNILIFLRLTQETNRSVTHLRFDGTNSVALVMSGFRVVLIRFMSCRWTYRRLWPPSQSAAAPLGISHPPQHLFTAKASLGYVEQTGWVSAGWAAAGLQPTDTAVVIAKDVAVFTGEQHKICCISSAAGWLFYKTTARNIYYHNPLILDTFTSCLILVLFVTSTFNKWLF